MCTTSSTDNQQAFALGADQTAVEIGSSSLKPRTIR